MPPNKENQSPDSIKRTFRSINEMAKNYKLFEIYSKSKDKFKIIYSQYRVHYGETEIWLLSEVFEPDQYLPHLQYILKEFNTSSLPKKDVGRFVTIMVKYFFTKLGEQWNLFPCVNRFYPYISWFYDIDLEHNKILVCLPPDNIASGKANLSDITEKCNGTTEEASIVVKKLLESMLKSSHNDKEHIFSKK